MSIEIGLSTWSFHRHMGPVQNEIVTELGEKHEWTVDYPEDISLIGFAGFAKKEYDISHLELTQMCFPSTDASYLEELKGAVEVEGAIIQNVPIDVGYICEPDANIRAEHIREIKKWIGIAATIGSRAVRVNTGPAHEGSDALALAIESYKHLTDYAAGLGLDVLIENHGGVSSDPDMIARIIEAVSSHRLGACPDFGGFDNAVLYEALETIMPFAKVVHAKSYRFDEDGEETKIDYGRCLEIIKKSGFDGVISIEYEGEDDQYEGVRKTKELILKHL
jgi:sugar phosphate isomerase/epimerase